MRKQLFKTFCAVFFLFALLVVGSQRAYANANIVIIVNDGPNEGFNDPTTAAPVGGNPGTTKGAQRLYAFEYAANIWGSTLDSPETIYIVASFDPLGANVLGSAGAWDVFSDFTPSGFFPGPEFAATWYGSALADKRAGHDLDSTSPDIIARFSSDFNFYLGVDNNHGAQNDLVAVLLHELAHGLGFQNFVNESTGANLGGFTDPSTGRFYPVQTDIYARHTLDITNNLTWDAMTQAERQASAVRYGRVVWNGTAVTADLPSVLSFGSPEVRILTPAAIAGPYQFGGAVFGPSIASSNVTASVVAAVDEANATGPTTTDGCTAFTNAAAVAGNIALIERGTCGFALKARNATNAGAVGVIIYNNAANVNSAPPGMADDGINGAFVTIPTASLIRADGLAIVAQLGGGVTAHMGSDPTIRAGADALGRARLYAPFPVASGSSGSHYDSIAFRNLLMEPAINPDLTHSVKAPEDLTLELLRDVGWFPDADNDGIATANDCNDNSDLRPTVVIGTCDSGVPNTLFISGCTVSDLIQQIAAGAKNHGAFVAGVTQLTNGLKKNGLINDVQKDAILSCAGSSTIP